MGGEGPACVAGEPSTPGALTGQEPSRSLSAATRRAARSSACRPSPGPRPSPPRAWPRTCSRARRLLLNSPSPPLCSQSAGRVSQRLYRPTPRRHLVPAGPPRKMPGGVAVVVARVTPVPGRPARHLGALGRPGRSSVAAAITTTIKRGAIGSTGLLGVANRGRSPDRYTRSATRRTRISGAM